MTVRSTQPRPSQQVRGTDRAVAFATKTPRRSSSLDAALLRTSTSPVRSPASMPNPNRSTRRWGTVSIRETEAMAHTRRELRSAHESGVESARQVHPATGRAGAVAVNANRPSTIDRRTSAGNTTATASAQSNVVALRSQSQKTRRSSVGQTGHAAQAALVAEKTQAALPTQRRQPVLGSGSDSVRAHSKSSRHGARGSSKALQMAVAIDLHSDGSVALAPKPKLQPAAENGKAAKSESRTSKPKLQVVRPQRNVKRSVLRPYSALLAIGLIFAGAISAIVMHADLAKNQLVLDKVRREVGAEERTNQRLRVEVAELEAPARVIAAANQLGLVSAERVDYTTLSDPADQ
jgi:cell division protein FtsL